MPFTVDTPAVLDGGLSNQLAAAGHDLSDRLWSARLLRDDPDAILAAHRAYFEAGADIATTASYQASELGFGDETPELLRLSVRLARQASFQAEVDDRRLWVAASVGPYGAVLADGSEYRGRYGLSVRELVDFHRPRIEALASAAPDVLALETIPDLDEAEALLTIIAGTGIPAWLSYSIDGSTTRAGQPLAEAFALVRDVPEILAVGVNCCDPLDATAAVPVAAAVSGKPVVVYPNSGEGWDPVARSWDGRPTFDPSVVPTWIHDGATIVGGCCQLGPADIAAIARAVSR
ncbi:homocysteine S-methyltransferase [Kutzneria sp. CA-103260]|uniref:homocysteine S-methyltransferase n=1 Tax=Kutzneria sp. CA-103260 TaxID=2802641 RepID=UPI001BA959E5|nr:homocysteine S-methyltransferase [Kutzneria sp. CA-103260]QUQ62617.1 homocysteine S-methyltransferase [Kutzneria sp. CA-103260]